MGGRGAGSGSSGGGSGGVPVSSVVSQGGQTLDLSQFPLKYGKADSSLSGAARSAVEAFEKSHLQHKTEYGILLDANGNQIYTAHGGKGSVSMPRYFYSKADIMSHNHPRGKGDEGMLGGTFSGADLQVFAQSGLSTMRAAAAEGTYSISKGANFDKQGFSTYAKQVEQQRYSKYKSKMKQLAADVNSGKIRYSEYSTRADHEFNHMLVGMHNDILAGAKQYGYNYTLERRTP